MHYRKNTLSLFLVPAILGFAMGLVDVADAALPKTEFKPSPILKGEGFVTGGRSEKILSLMDLRRSASPQRKTERIVLDFGNSKLEPATGLVSYYHAELQKNPNRFILELPQTFASPLSEKQIQDRFKGSLYIKSAMVQFDRSLQSMTMILELKKPMQVKVAPVRSQKSSGKLVVDFQPL